MNQRSLQLAAACALALSFGAASTAQAARIPVSYAYNVSYSREPMAPPLLGLGEGSVTPLGSMTWEETGFQDYPARDIEGTFTMTFSTGDTLFGTFHYIGNFFRPPVVPFTQSLYVTGGTCALVGYQGPLTGEGVLSVDDAIASPSGTGVLYTTPEPESFILSGIGIACLLAYRKRASTWRKQP